MQEENEEKFSEDPNEHFRIENEILKMKLKAELGHNFQIFGDSDALPPEIENQFLNYMIQMEEIFQQEDLITIREKIGNPTLVAPYLEKVDYVNELEKILNMLLKHDICFNVIYDEYPADLLYAFVYNHLLDLDIERNMPKGTTVNFIYEEFVPNREQESKETIEDFVEALFDKNFEQVKFCVADGDLLIGKSVMSQEQFLTRLKNFVLAFSHFEDVMLDSKDVNVLATERMDLDEALANQPTNAEEDLGNIDSCIATITGYMAFDAVMENTETLHYEGDFKFVLQLNFGMWRVASADFPGMRS
jgi:hypothetical protein